ncbi:MAG: sigma-54-dependent Fis family transcriptional regulator [Myxococcales bacterium]|nr:MAG: sigma-54-dependent Fis family transcriptional regulator [Myxococcales bacterium]
MLWEGERDADQGRASLLTRAELQAYCGNEDAALCLIAELDPGSPSLALVRARVAASRGDWESALRWANHANGDGAVRTRALQVAARATIELGRMTEASELFDDIEEPSPEAGLLRAHTVDGDVAEALTQAAHDASRDGAARIAAEAWTDLALLCQKRNDDEGMRKATMRAVGLWDDLAMTLPPPLRTGFWSDVRRQSVRTGAKRPKGRASAPPGKGLRPLLVSLRRLASERDLSKLLDLITDGAVALSGAERGFVLLVDDKGKLETRTIRGAEEQLGRQTAAFSRSIAETVLIDGEPVVTVDAAQDARVQDYMSVHQLMLKSVACMPIETRGRTWGVLYLEHRSARGRFSGTDLSMLRAFADQAAIAIETAHLLERVESQKRDLEHANEALQDANVRLEDRLHGQSEALEQTRREIVRLQGSTAAGDRWGLVGVSEEMQRVYEVLGRVAINEVPVVITGESGTGKELVASAIHRGSARADGPYVSLSCGAIPEGLLESELFGHVAGAFTGAARGRAGVFIQANGGTLFMDEIADMPPRMQLDLLRVLQECRVRPVGSADEKPVDVRVITASKRPLRELIDEGRLREDLYYRLAVVELELPPLRERRADIPLLCDHFLRRIAKERGEPKKRLSRSAVRRLAAHDFPGNVRELEHLLVNATVFATGGTIDAEQLAIEEMPLPKRAERDVSNYRHFKEAERDRILDALNAHGWNRAQAARSLGMARRTFYRRLKQHGIELPQGKG